MSNNIHYIKLDITRDQSAAQRLSSMGVKGVPAFLVDGELITGFDKARLLKLLEGPIAECPKCRTKHRLPEGKGRIRITCSKCKTKFDVIT